MLPFLLSAVFAAPLADGPLKIVGRATAPPHTIVELRPSSDPSGGAVDWEVLPEGVADMRELPDGTLYVVAPPGTYTVKLSILRLEGQKLRKQSARMTLVIEGAKPLPKPDQKRLPAEATGRLLVGSSGCTATVIHPRRADGRWDILTAAHCTDSAGTRGVFTMKDGRKLKVAVSKRDTKADICWLVTEDATIDDLPTTTLADPTPPVGTPIWHNGYGVDKPGNVERGTINKLEDKNGQLSMILSVSSGDSGGGVFVETTGELVASVCCTVQKGSKVEMWGGSGATAAKLRPRGVSFDEDAVPAPSSVKPDERPLQLP